MIQKLKKIFEANTNSENAYAMSKYMKFKFEFYGIKKPERKLLQKAFILEAKSIEVVAITNIIEQAFQEEKREMHYFGIDLLHRISKQFREEDIELIEKLIQTNSWWDSVDSIAMATGEYFGLYKSNKEKIINTWVSSENLWLNRVAILFQLKYKTQTNLRLLGNIINALKHKDEFFIQKAIGWALREYSKTDSNWVVNYIEKENIQGLAKREGLKKIVNGL